MYSDKEIKSTFWKLIDTKKIYVNIQDFP